MTPQAQAIYARIDVIDITSKTYRELIEVDNEIIDTLRESSQKKRLKRAELQTEKTTLLEQLLEMDK